MPTSTDRLLDTSAAIALVHDVHPSHDRVVAATQGRVLGLCGHAAFETYSVLTRLPGAARVSPERAADIIDRAFPVLAPLPTAAGRDAVRTFAEAGIAGGAVYDGLVALCARAAGVRLLTCDRRAMGTYAALGVDVMLV